VSAVLDIDNARDAISDEDIIAECKARFKICEDAEGENRGLAIDDLSFADGNQWPDDITNTRKNRPTPVINHVATFVRRVVNNLKQQRPRIKCHPMGDGADVDQAEVWTGLIRHIENRSTASIAYDTGGESAVKIGWGYWRIIGEYVDEMSFDQEIAIQPIRNVFTVYMDPASVLPTGEDQMWCIETGTIKRVLYKALYPDAPNVEWKLQANGDSAALWESKEELRLAQYYRIREKPEKLYKLVTGGTAFASDIKRQGAEKYIAKDATGKPIARNSFKRQVEWFRINGETIADRRILPGKYIPIIRVEGNVLDLNGKIQRKGMIRDLKDPQCNFNYMTAAKIERLALTPKAPWRGYEDVIDGHPEWHDANTKNYSILIGKAVQGPNGEILPLPERQPPAGLENGFAEAAQSSEHDLMAIAGMPHEPGQDSQGEVVSGKAIQRRQALSDQSHYQYFDNQTLAIAHTGRILLDWIPAYYDMPRMQRIIGADGTPEMIGINQQEQGQDENGQAIQTIKNDMTAGEFDVVMDTGPGYQTQREEGAENLMTLVNSGKLGEMIAEVGADLVVRSIDGPYMQELADRLAAKTPQGLEKIVSSLPKQAQAVVKTMGAQLQAAQGKIQELEADLKHQLTKSLHQDATKLQIANLSDDTKRQDTHTNAFTKVEDTHTKAHTQIAVAEIRAGAQLLNSHVEAEHNKAAAEVALKAAESAEKEPA
jgi:hypothetical protein